MRLEERSLGVQITPEVRAAVRTAFERAFDGMDDRVDHVRVRLAPARRGVMCRARLWPISGATLMVGRTRASTVEAIAASANSLARALDARRGRSQRRDTRELHLAGEDAE